MSLQNNFRGLLKGETHQILKKQILKPMQHFLLATHLPTSTNNVTSYSGIKMYNCGVDQAQTYKNSSLNNGHR